MLSEHIDALPYLECSIKEWKLAGQISFQLRRSGITIPISDIAIAATAINNNASIYTLDEHFKNVPNIRLYT